LVWSGTGKVGPGVHATWAFANPVSTTATAAAAAHEENFVITIMAESLPAGQFFCHLGTISDLAFLPAARYDSRH
jgi:hypothetical protein